MIFKKSTINSEDKNLEIEARLFAHYLLDCEPLQDMVDRYVRANEKLGVNPVNAEDKQILDFSVSNPWTIPFLDAAVGIRQPDAVLRKKIYIMAAVLEASPLYSDKFLPEVLPPLKLFYKIIANSLKACSKAMIGIPMLMVVRNRTYD